MSATCLYCNGILSGRLGKKFCTPHCRSAYHYKENKQKQDKLYVVIDKQLKLNRRILKEYNKAGLATVRKQKLLDAGFNPKYFTHYWKNKKGQVYLFCYEFGFLEVQDSSNIKYVLIKWQAYMDKSKY